jgi:hypothetical protein
MAVRKKIPREAKFLQALISNIGADQTSALIHHGRMQYQALYKNRKEYPNRALQEHLDKSILPGIAIYQSLLAYGYPKEEALGIMEAVFREWSKTMRRRMKRLGRLPFYYGILRLLIKPMMRLNFPEEGWKIEWKEHNQDLIAFNITSCFYQEILREYDVLELTPLYCWMDDLVYEEASPYLKWDRTKTLGREDDCCDFRFIRNTLNR